MPEFSIMKGKEAIGVVDITENGFSLITNRDMGKLLAYFRQHFKEMGTSIDNKEITYRFESKLPTTSYFEVLLRVRSGVNREQYHLSSDSITGIT
jgi:uncharacterized protein YfbU (UPF0304 family)